MSNFPIQFTDKVNSPELLAIMQQFGEQTYVDAELINKFRDALNELHARTADTRIVENTGLQIVGTDVVINELWKWLILSVLYSNDSQITLPITLSSEGNQKLCYLCANQDNGFELVYGPESETNPVAPTIDDNLLYITFFLVTDGTVGIPAEPIVGDIFKKKSESSAYNDPTLSGSDAVIQFQPNGESVYAFSNAGLVSIDGFGLDLITGNPSAEVPYPGKDIFIFNNKSGNLTLKHDGSGTAQCKFFFIDETDLIIPPGGKVWLKYGPSYCEVIFKSWSEESKRKSVIEISFAGGNFSNASGYWFGIGNYGGKYNQSYTASASLTPTDNFSTFNQFFGYHEKVPFDCKIKKVHVFMANNGGTYNLDVAILNYKIGETFIPSAGSGVYDRIIVAREQFVSNLGGFNKTMLDANVDNEYVLSKGSFNRLFINTGGSTNAPIQNPMILIEIEEL